MPIRRCRRSTETPFRAGLVEGKHSHARSKPAFHKLVVANRSNNPPRWLEVAEVVRKILCAYKENAKNWERMSERIERIGWPRFFELAALRSRSTTSIRGRRTQDHDHVGACAFLIGE